MEKKGTEENYKSLDSGSSVKEREMGSNTDLKKYVMWENKFNICWLDASLALIAHNEVMKRYSKKSPKSNISKIISSYDEATTILNGSENGIGEQQIYLARGKLRLIQESVLQYLQPLLKYKTGDPESAFCSLLNLLNEDANLRCWFSVQWISKKECTSCGRNSQSVKNKPIITLSKIDSFDPVNPSIIYNCVCDKSQQKIRLVYVRYPPCIIFHFENGAGNECPPLSFITRGREYHLTAIMTFSRSTVSTVNHFITWIRNPSTNKWLDCNDLNPVAVSFSPDFPDVKFNDAYMYVYESFDDLEVIVNKEIGVPEPKVYIEESIPCFDLTDSDTESSSSQNTAVKSDKTETMKIGLKSSNDTQTFNDDKTFSASLENNNKTLKKNDVKTFSELFEDKLLKTLESIDENTIEKNIPLRMGIQNSNDVSNNTVNLNTNKIIKSTEADMVKVPREIIKANNDDLNIPPGLNTRNIDENACKSDCTENNYNDLVVKMINDNSCSMSTVKETLKENSHSISEDRPEICKVKCKTPDKNSSKVCSSKIYNKKPEMSKSLTNLKVIDSIQFEHKTDEKKKCMDNSKQLFRSSDAVQSIDENLVFNSNAEQEKQFLANAAVHSFEPSYVRISLRKKKSSTHPFYQKRNTGSPDSYKISNMDNPSPSKSLQRKIVPYSDEASSDDPCYALNKSPKKRKRSKKTSTVKRNDDITTKKYLNLEGQAKASKIGPKKISRVKSSASEETVEDQEKIAKIGPKRKRRVKSNPSEEAVLENNSGLKAKRIQRIKRNSNATSKSSNNLKILKNFEHLYSSHKPDCFCSDSSDLEDMLDCNVDFAIGYFLKLSQECKNFAA